MSADVYSIVTERMIALLEAGTAPWRKTWRGGESPRNLINKKPYRGINTLLLGSTSFTSPYWLTVVSHDIVYKIIIEACLTTSFTFPS